MAISQILDKTIHYSTLTLYSLSIRPNSRSTPSMSTSASLQAENSAFLARTGIKIPLRIHQNTPLQVKKIHFFQTLLSVGRGTPLPTPHPMMFQTSLLGSGIRLSRNSGQIYANTAAPVAYSNFLSPVQFYFCSVNARWPFGWNVTVTDGHFHRPTCTPWVTNRSWLVLSATFYETVRPSVLWHCWLGHLTCKNPSPIWPIMCLVGR